MKKDEFITKRSLFKVQNSNLNSVFNNLLTITLRNWIFQGFFDLSIQEKIYKLLFDLTFVIIAYIVGFNSIASISIVFFIVHTINWLTNDHFVDNLYHLHICKNNPVKMEHSIIYLKKVINNFDSIAFAGIYGRISRGEEVHPGTDIDIRLLRKKGFISNFTVCFIGHYLRFVCLIKLIPIDLNIWNQYHDLNRMRKDENPLVIKDEIGASNIYSGMDIKTLIHYKRHDIRWIR